MPTIHKHLHVIIFIILLLLVGMLNLGPFSVGWPIPIVTGRPHWLFDSIVHTLVNALPCMMILSLSMAPFAYDSKRSFSAKSILMFTTAASFGFLILTPSYMSNYQTGDHLLIVAMTAMSVNGLLHWLTQFLSKYVDLPQWRKPERSNGNELDFD